MAQQRYSRFSDISVSEKILNTVFLLTIGLGYLFALANLYYTHQGRDNKPGLSIDDVMIMYHGSHSQTRLGSAINGIMEPNLKFKTDKDVIHKWLSDGATEEGYKSDIAPILNRDCVICHNPTANPHLPNLTTFIGVSEVAQAGGGAPLPVLIRVGHIHIFGIAFILFFIGKLFLLCEMNVYLKRITVVIPFFAMLLDVMSWFITKTIPEFAYVVIGSGALMGISMAMQILVSVYQMWFYKRTPNLPPPDLP